MANIVKELISQISDNDQIYVKILSDNEMRKTNSHQYGILISRDFANMIFEESLPDEGITSRFAKISWVNFHLESTNRFIYYSSKHELRITNFDKGFPLFDTEYPITIFVLVKKDYGHYIGCMLTDNLSINGFLNFLTKRDMK